MAGVNILQPAGAARAGALLSPAQAALGVGAVAALTIGGALFFEHVMGVKPCELCLVQRIPYYGGIPLALLATIVAARQPRSLLATGLLLLLAIVFLVGSGMGVYHAGIEWGLWAGPTGCTGPVTGPAAMGDFLKQLESVKVIRCDEVAMRVFGLSLAAWNAIIAAGLAGLAAYGAWASRKA